MVDMHLKSFLSLLCSAADTTQGGLHVSSSHERGVVKAVCGPRTIGSKVPCPLMTDMVDKSMMASRGAAKSGA